MPLFDIDYHALLEQKLPVRWRNPVMIAWCRVLISRVVYLKAEFDTNRAANLYRLAHNGQICKLCAALNNKFDPALRGIFIGNGAFVEPVYIYLISELKPVYMYQISENKPVYMRQISEVYTGEGVSFVVHVPAGLGYDVNQMEALIDDNKLAGKVYSIVSP